MDKIFPIPLIYIQNDGSSKDAPENALTSNDSKGHSEDTDNKGGVSVDNDKILEKYMDSINQDRRDMEKRLMDDRRESEVRIDKKFTETMEAIKEQNNKIDKMGEKIDSAKGWIIGVCITTILGIAAMVVSIILSKI